MNELARWDAVIRCMPSGVVRLKATVDSESDGYRLRAYMRVDGKMYVALKIIPHPQSVEMDGAEMRDALARLASQVIVHYKMGLPQP